ncbi:MAG: glycosyltransferase family 2 protein [Actinomycetota bacterium]|nr:glycosyltransferase family 2 protein [Actinomycetota bacterium]
MTARYHVYVSPRGNVFMAEIATMVAASLEDLEHDVVFPAPGLPEHGSRCVNVVIAPHEFFPLQEGRTERSLLDAAAASVLIGVEQPGTSWFELSAHYASVARAVFDISTYAADELSRRGLDARHLQLGYHSSWDRWGGDETRYRPRDVLFLGSATARRDRYLAEAAPLLWDCSADLRLFEFPRPMSAPRGHFVAARTKWDLLASSRMLMNIHRNDVPYFEWVRVLEAVINGCLVISEHSRDYGPLVPGEHLVAVPPEMIGAYTASLLVDEPLRTELTTAAYDFVRTKLDFNETMAGVCDTLDRLAETPAAARRDAQAFQPPAPPRVPEPSSALQAALDTERVAWGRIKELLDSETATTQAIESMQARLRFGAVDHAEVIETSAWAGFTPDVTVLITSFNYVNFVSEAMASAMASEGIDAELIIVDDHSQDASVDTIRATMADNDWFPMMLVAKAANSGVGTARNLGFTRARADRVLVLDADNLIFPNTLAKLSAALDRTSEASFSYGIIAKTGQPGLLSHLPWDVERLVQDNYIDALAMIRKQAWEAVGGYDDYASLRGWEDWEFWLRMAADGREASFVPEFVAQYRIHGTSRQAIVNLHTAPLRDTFRARYPFLPWEDN